LDCSGIRYKIPETPIGQLTIKNENGINVSSIGGTAIIDDKKIVKGIAFKRYEFPLDIEYCQVLTAVTITLETRFGQPFIKTNPEFPLTSAPESFWNIINRNQIGYWFQSNETNPWRFGGGLLNPPTPTFVTNPLVTLDDLSSKTILILQRGVDPYSPKYINRYQIGNLFGNSENDPNFIFTASTRLNVPIQSLPQNSTISVQNHKNSDEIFYPSVFFEPGIPSSLFPVTSSNPGYSYSSYTTSNVGYYGALDKTWFNNNDLSIIISEMSVLFTLIENTNDNDLINEING
jgi:hypothetical protein